MLKIKSRKIKVKGKEVILDIEDYNKYAEGINIFHYWNGKYYVQYEGKFLHRIIMECEKGELVDHINGNTLDNRRSNLRKCTNTQNQYNVSKKANSKQKYKGVRKTRHGTYDARIRYKGQRLHLGTYKTELEAVLVYNAKAKELHGEYAYINEI